MTGRARPHAAHRAGAVALAAALVALDGPLAGCHAPPPAPAARAARPRVVIESPSGRRSAVDVELARTPAEQARGLMGRTALAPDAGMLFLFDDESEHVFWMKDTPLPLDMIFIGGDGAVVGIVERAEPYTEDPRTVRRPSRSVLEVHGGWARAHDVRVGDRVAFEGVDRR